MKHSDASRGGWARKLLAKPGVADAVAEGLMVHDHECFARQAAVHVIDAAGLTEVQFLESWKDGEFDV